MLLAGDIGGTNTRLGLFERTAGRPRRLAVGMFATLEYGDLAAIVAAFITDQVGSAGHIEAACLGVAGPVLNDAARLTNVPWRIEAREIARAFDIGHVRLLNDLEAMAFAVPVLAPSELHVLQEGRPSENGNMALIAAGTGLGEAVLHNVEGRFVPVASEAGHADFPARSEREIALVRDLWERFGHAEIEHVVSGAGIVNLHRIAHTQPCRAGVDAGRADAPASITRAALEGQCPGCVETLDMFVDAYGAEAGNLALRSTAMAGVFIGGGIAPRILRALDSGRFMNAFRDKLPPFCDMLASIPVKVILNDDTGLLGAAVRASTL